MAEIVAAIGSSHVPSIGTAYDLGKQDTDEWRPLFSAYSEVKSWLEREVRPDAVIIVYNDHGTNFFFDSYPTFAIGVSDEYPIGDEGFGPRRLPPVTGDAALAWHLTEALVADEFDLNVCQEMTLDHGALVPLPLLWSHDPSWNIRVVPLQVNVLQHPLPSAMRCYKLGQALRRAIESYPCDDRVVVVGTGGMSHQLNGERFGYMNPEFDRYFLDTISTDPLALAGLSHEELMRNTGAEGVELIMWLTMRGALGERVREVHRNYYAPMTTGMGLVALVDD
jgi:protocatechuate 4,5-dioxygenase, beta chain